jgi:peptidoglycan/LPS O-acetylase OafA/YrhL
VARILAAASLAVRTVVHVADDGSLLPNTLLGTFTWFALGMGLAVTSVAVEGREQRPRSVALIVRRPWLAWAAGAALFAFTAYGMGLPRGFPPRYTELSFLGEHLLYGAVSFLLLLPAVFGDQAGGWPRRVLASRVLAWLGLISYGVYLWHLPLIDWLIDQGAQGWIPGLGLPRAARALAGAHDRVRRGSYYLVERPLLRLKDPRPPAVTARAAPA